MALVESKWSGGRKFMKKKKSSQGLLPDDWRRMGVDSGLTSGEVSGESSVARLDDYLAAATLWPVQDQSRLNFTKGCLCRDLQACNKHAKACKGTCRGARGRSLMQGN
jgi:hypothetical protein